MYQWLKRRFAAIDAHVNRIGYWYAFFALVWLAMSGTVSLIEPILRLGIGVIILVGLGISCILVLVGSVSLVAWRYFRPTKQQIASESPSGQTSQQLNRDLVVLLNYAVYQSTVLLLDSLLKAAPSDVNDGPLQLGGDFSAKNEASQEFVKLVRGRLEYRSHRWSTFENLMQSATNEAEYQVENTPIDQRPQGIDPLLLRRWTIAHLQCVRAVVFLESERKEAQDILLSQRSGLLERYTLRNG